MYCLNNFDSSQRTELNKITVIFQAKHTSLQTDLMLFLIKHNKILKYFVF